MIALKQLFSVTAVGLSSIPARLGTSMVVVIGVAAVVAVTISALAVATGFSRAAAGTGDPGRAMILGGDTEAASEISRENAVTIINAPGVRVAADGAPVASAESLVFIPLADRNTGFDAFATLRGVGPQAFALRPEVTLVEGRLFQRGAQEVIVGRAVQRRLGALALGSGIALPNGEWKVVGTFESGADAHESELMTDAEMLLNAYRRNGYNSVTVRLDGAQAFEHFESALSSDPTLSVTAQREDEYYARSSRQVSQLLIFIAYGIGGIMAFGAAFGALNTLYSAVSTRAPEIATLRAIGFGAGAVVISVLVEALVLALAGAGIGAVAAWVLFDGSTISTMTGTTPSQLTFGLQVDAQLILIGILFAAAIAAIGGLFASIRAARVSVATALRMV